jgi:hypothetical protein
MLARELHQRVAGGGIAAQAVDHFDDFHQRHGVEEVIADHARRVGAAGGNRRDRQRRRIRRQDAAAADDVSSSRNSAALDVEFFDDRFDHQIAIRQIADGLRTG